MKQAIETSSYAIFKTGGKQYQAITGKTIAIEKLTAEPGEQVIFNDVLLRKTTDANGNETIEVGQPYLKSSIKASIVKHLRGPKIIIFHFKRRQRRNKTKTGHRQSYTVVRIESI